MEDKDLSRGKMNENSLLAYFENKESHDVMRIKILKTVDGLMCTLEIAQKFGKHLHKISGRFSELEAKNQIIKIGNKKIGNSRFGVYRKIN